MKKLKGKVIWITGASSGIGEALAYECSSQGNSLVISGRQEQELQRVRTACARPELVKLLPLDLQKNVEHQGIVKSAVGCFGHIDLLINNAGISQRSLISETSLEVYKKLMDVNYLGTVSLSLALLPHFLERGEGHFATVSSVMGKFGSPYRAGYCAAKHALHGFFDVLRMEHQKDGVVVTMVCPGFVQTNIARNALLGDGSSKKSSDPGTEKGMVPAVFAKKMIRALAIKKREVYIGGTELMGVYVKRFFPALLQPLVLRSQVR